MNFQSCYCHYHLLFLSELDRLNSPGTGRSCLDWQKTFRLLCSVHFCPLLSRNYFPLAAETLCISCLLHRYLEILSAFTALIKDQSNRFVASDLSPHFVTPGLFSGDWVGLVRMCVAWHLRKRHGHVTKTCQWDWLSPTVLGIPLNDDFVFMWHVLQPKATVPRLIQSIHHLNEKILLSGEIDLRGALEDYSLMLRHRSIERPWNLPGLIASTDLETYNGFS